MAVTTPFFRIHRVRGEDGVKHVGGVDLGTVWVLLSIIFFPGIGTVAMKKVWIGELGSRCEEGRVDILKKFFIPEITIVAGIIATNEMAERCLSVG